jgi:hypothetical protein
MKSSEHGVSGCYTKSDDVIVEHQPHPLDIIQTPHREIFMPAQTVNMLNITILHSLLEMIAVAYMPRLIRTEEAWRAMCIHGQEQV